MLSCSTDESYHGDYSCEIIVNLDHRSRNTSLAKLGSQNPLIGLYMFKTAIFYHLTGKKLIHIT